MHLLNTILTNSFHSLRQHSPLILQMIKRKAICRYRNSFLGLVWPFINPALMLYTFVLSVVFKVRLDPQHHEIKDDTLTSYFIFTGLMLILIFNFLVFITEQVRAMILYEQLSHWSNIARYYLLEIFVAWTGLIGPNKTRQGFADVL